MPAISPSNPTTTTDRRSLSGGRARFGLAAIAGLALLATGCPDGSVDFSIGGQTPEDAAIEVIEGELAEQLGLELTGECDDVEDPEVGSTFRCQGTTPDGQVVEFATEIDREDHINVETTNVVTAASLTLIEDNAGAALGEQVGVPVTIECGDDSIIFDDESDLTIDCEADDGTNQRDAVVTITDIETGQFNINLV